MQRFLNKVQKTEGCWLWVGGRTTSGYGNFWNGSKLVPAHRWSYEAHKGPIPDHLYACHKCDTPACVNPDHLFLGTPHQNYLDAREKGRLVGCSYKLNPEKVSEIRYLRDLGVPRKRVAEMYEVGVGAIESIEKHESWKVPKGA